MLSMHVLRENQYSGVIPPRYHRLQLDRSRFDALKGRVSAPGSGATLPASRLELGTAHPPKIKKYKEFSGVSSQ